MSDYHSVLINGYACREEIGGSLLLDRVGPFTPPIFFPWFQFGGHMLIVSGPFADQIRARLPEIRLRKAMMRKVVPIRWETWNLFADSPEVYPSGPEVEPGDYIEYGAHDPIVADSMSACWEILPPCIPAKLRWVSDRCKVEIENRRYEGLFCFSESDHNNLSSLVDGPTRAWLESVVGDWVRFEDVDVTSAASLESGENP